MALSAVLAEVAAAKSSLEWLKCGFAVGGGAVAWMKSKAARKKDYQVSPRQENGYY